MSTYQLRAPASKASRYMVRWQLTLKASTSIGALSADAQGRRSRECTARRGPAVTTKMM